MLGSNIFGEKAKWRKGIQDQRGQEKRKQVATVPEDCFAMQTDKFRKLTIRTITAEPR